MNFPRFKFRKGWHVFFMLHLGKHVKNNHDNHIEY